MEPRRRPELSREIVVACAVRILDAEGETALSYRRLAAELGAGTTSVVWYVPSREVLLDLALDVVAGELWASIPARRRRASTDWRRDLRAVARQMYRTLGSRPWAGRQQLRSANRGPHQMRVWDHVGRLCLQAGLDERQAFYAMTAILSYVLGYVSQENASADRGVGRDASLRATGDFMAALDPAGFPALHGMVDVFVHHSQQAQFDAGLDMLLDGIAARRDRPA